VNLDIKSKGEMMEIKETDIMRIFNEAQTLSSHSISKSAKDDSCHFGWGRSIFDKRVSNGQHLRNYDMRNK